MFRVFSKQSTGMAYKMNLIVFEWIPFVIKLCVPKKRFDFKLNSGVAELH